MLPSLKKRKVRSGKKPGTAPGTVQHIGEQRVDEVQITIHDYSEGHVDEIAIRDIEEARPDTWRIPPRRGSRSTACTTSKSSRPSGPISICTR
ncbi:MAG: hypothetical protein U5K31_12695 [Balneolaceae bacterium]|nr:hypothetical protein [Balneolaceae bacterium]